MTITSLSRQQLFSGFCLLALCALLFALHAQVPRIADDYCRFQPSFSFMKVVDSVIDTYLNWSGRLVVMAINFTVFSGGEAGLILTNLANSLAFCLAVFLIVRMQGSMTAPAQLLLGLSFIATLGYTSVRMGEIYLWKTGAVQYFWGSLMALYVVWFITTKTQPSKPLTVVFYLACFLLGTWLENLSAAVWVTVILRLIYQYWFEQHLPTPWQIGGVILLTLGLGLLLAAPGNYARVEAIGDPRSLLETVWLTILRLADFTHPLVILLAGIFALLTWRFDREQCPIKLQLAGWIALAGVLSTMAMSFAPAASFVIRAGFPQEFLLVAATVVLFPTRLVSNYATAAGIASIAIVVLLTPIYLGIFKQYQALTQQEAFRQEIIELSKSYGNTSNIPLPPLVLNGQSTFTGTINEGWWFVRDIRTNPADWRNACYAKAFGVDSVILVDFPEP